MHVALAGPANPRAFAAELGQSVANLPTGLGGTPVNLLAKALLAAGHEVSLVTCCPNVPRTRSFHSGALTVHCVPWRIRARDRALTQFRREIGGVAKVLRAADADVVHAHWTYEYALAALKSGQPTVVTIHDSPTAVLAFHRDIYRSIRLLMAVRVRRHAPAMTAVSPYVAEQWRRGMRFAGRVDIVPNIARGHSGSGTRRHNHILVVADDHSRKNAIAAVRAHQLIRSHVPEATMRLVGPGLEPDGCFARGVHTNGAGAGIEFVGAMDHAALLIEMGRASLLIHPSREEAQCMVLNEALASSLPVVAGKTSGGVPWSLGHGKAGVLVDIDSPEDIASAATRLLRDEAMRERYALAGRELVDARYSARAVATAYIQVYDKILSRLRAE